MAKFSALMQTTASTSLAVGAVLAAASTPRRAKIYDIMFGSQATPADNAFLWQLQRQTTVGTASAFTPLPLDPADAAATTVCEQAYTVNGTLTANAIVLTVPLNQRASFRWVAAPGSELMVPATASNGIATLTPTSSAVLVTATELFEEQ